MKYATYENFRAVCARRGVPEARCSSIYRDLVTRYSEKHRSYHNLEHIDRLLRIEAECGITDDAVELATWFHDVIYDPKGEHNERKSADYFLSQFDGYVWYEFLSEVERLILATDPTKARRGTNREDFMIDVDLSILGTESTEYQSYTEAVREEYSFVPEQDFREGRSKILNSFLANKIFATEHFEKFEAQARSNITQELERLENGAN